MLYDTRGQTSGEFSEQTLAPRDFDLHMKEVVRLGRELAQEAKEGARNEQPFGVGTPMARRLKGRAP